MRAHLRDWNTMVVRPFNLPGHLHATNWTARETRKFIDRRDPDKPVKRRDIMATVIDVCGIEMPPTVDGCSMVEAVNGGAWRDYLHGEHCTCYSTNEEMQYVTDGKRKYIWFPRTRREQYFDLETDPKETTCQVTNSTYAEEVAVWRQRLVDPLQEGPGLVESGKLVVQEGPIISLCREHVVLSVDEFDQIRLRGGRRMISCVRRRWSWLIDHGNPSFFCVASTVGA